jgi:hypothetical protein
MKVEKWTLGLAAVGLVSLPAMVGQAEEQTSPLMTAVSQTTISGAVDTSAHWNLGTGSANLPRYSYNEANKGDGFNLNVVRVSIEKPLDDATWSAGYKTDLLFGPDARMFNTGSLGSFASDFAIRQAYVALRAPVGNGLDFKMGVFDTIVGYEGHDNASNPNYTRSYAYSIEPTTHTGVLMMYEFTEWLSAAAGVANTYGPIINERAFASPGNAAYEQAESYKTYMGSIALTAPESMGFLTGATLYGGVINGFDSNFGVSQHFYVGAKIPTPLQGLTVGAAYDYRGADDQNLRDVPPPGEDSADSIWANAVAGYLSYQATEKLSLHARAEYVWVDEELAPNDNPATLAYEGVGGLANKVFAVTGTLQYDLWKNVLTRLEFRWDHAADGSDAYGGDKPNAAGNIIPDRQNSYLVAANVIYRF